MLHCGIRRFDVSKLQGLLSMPDGSACFFHPRKRWFWQALVTSFCACCLIGHWLEFPYCWMTNSLFGIVDSDYALYIDPWFHPYWCYGFGALGMTLVLEPAKDWLVRKLGSRKKAMPVSFICAVFLAMLMELGIGLLVNQPDATGHYPYWDNSYLPFNVGGQAWLFNDVFIALAAMVYLWLAFPLVAHAFIWLQGRKIRSHNAANVFFAIALAIFAACCILSYTILALS